MRPISTSLDGAQFVFGVITESARSPAQRGAQSPIHHARCAHLTRFTDAFPSNCAMRSVRRMFDGAGDDVLRCALWAGAARPSQHGQVIGFVRRR